MTVGDDQKIFIDGGRARDAGEAAVPNRNDIGQIAARPVTKMNFHSTI